jgi:hypothetical protein
MRYFIGILIFFLLSSCKTAKFDSVTGKYRTKGGFEWGSNISLNKDSTFIYKWQTGLIYGETTGKWKLSGNNLVLDSDLQPQKDTPSSFYIIDKRNTNSSDIVFDLYFPDSTDVLIGANGLMFHDGDTIRNVFSDIHGNMRFPKQENDSIKILFIGLKDILISDSVNDYFKIATVDNNGNMYEYFTNETWQVRGNHLIDKSKNQNYYEKRFYKIE